MESRQLDTLARSLVTTGSRRMVLGATLAGVLGLLRPGEGMAKHKHKKHTQKHRRVSPPSSPPSPPSSPPSPPSPSPPSPPPPPPPPPHCPPVCPVCQTCDAASGTCFVDQFANGGEGTGCSFPNVCCSGTCCS